MIKWLLNLLKPTLRLDLKFVPYIEAEQLLRAAGSDWQIAPEEDHNHVRGWVWLERRGPST